MFRRTLVLLLGSLALAGCVVAGQQGGYGQPNPLAFFPPAGGPPAASARPVAILLPLSGSGADRGQAMLKGAQLALDAPGAPPLDARDTGGTPDGAAKAAHEAIGAGAAMILGPLTSAETAAVAPIGKQGGVPVLAFTNDAAQAQPGVWTLGITPLQQVRRLVGVAQTRGASRFAGLLPDNDFGRAMSAALQQATAAADLPPPSIRQYARGMASINTAMRDISDYANRGSEIDERIRAARARGDAEGKREAAELAHSRGGVPPPPFDAVLLADTGESLAEIASLLSYYDVHTSSVRILGPALWAVPSSGSGHFPGAWYAAPDPAARAGFDERYTDKYGSPAPALSDLAFDAASVARVFASSRYSLAALTNPEGFAGVDGLIVFQPDGQVRRGLAVFEIGSGGNSIIDPAPQSSGAPGV
ncbi:MAG: penicillin-binding protein activator [Acetobacteraceae bacterium]|nr:penicillin-binding protein activator [Acetobacteraceae bacterium]MBV8577318.1 penicillin-binding protein activator [Acetobacteraceae bacterium]